MPGTIIADPTMPAPRIRAIAYGPAGFREYDITSLGELAPLRGQTPVLWVNIDGLGDAATVTGIGEMFGLHKLALEDVVNTYQRAKVEPYTDHLFIVIREAVATGKPPELETDQVSIFLGDDFVITFQEKAGDCFDPVRDRIRKNQGRICQSHTDYLAYALIDAAIDAYYPVLETYGEKMEELEDETIERATKETVHRIHAIKRDFLIIRRAIWPAREAVATLIREDLPHITPECKIYLRDCYDHLIQLIDTVETYRETGSDLMEIYLSSASNRLNEVMKVLTIISTIFMPLAFITGVYGMNFDTSVSAYNMPELSWKYGYFFALGAILATVIGMLVFFRRRGWIGRPRR